MQCPSCHAEVGDSQKFCPSCGTALAPAGGSEAGPDVMIGQTLGGKYKVVRLLGEGGMGAVYEGEQQLGTTKRKVAVKTLHPHLSRDGKIKARFDFPLLGAPEPDAGPSLTNKLRTRIGVMFPATGHGTRLDLVDRATGRRWALPWPINNLGADAGRLD